VDPRSGGDIAVAISDDYDLGLTHSPVQQDDLVDRSVPRGLRDQRSDLANMSVHTHDLAQLWAVESLLRRYGGAALRIYFFETW
jgi:hypothetical protein